MIFLSLLLLEACSNRPAGAGATGLPPTPPVTPSASHFPLLPSESAESGPGQPPIIWVGGSLTEVTESSLVIKEALGSTVTLKRLGKGATAFYRASSARWERLSSSVRIGTGEEACVETALDGRNLLALRVFLGATCGPAA